LSVPKTVKRSRFVLQTDKKFLFLGMNHELKSIISSLQNVLQGHPWYGRAVFEILEEVNRDKQYIRPNGQTHSLTDLLYHMITWAEFTEQRIRKMPIKDMDAFNASDWRLIDPDKHYWQKGLAELQQAHDNIIALLRDKDDAFLEETVDYRKYNFRFLLNGLIQHNIYHLGQIAYLSKLL